MSYQIFHSILNPAVEKRENQLTSKIKEILSTMKIDLRLLPLKAYLFMFGAGLGCSAGFYSVLAKQLGFSATALGVIFLALPFFKIISNLLIGFICDYFKKFRLILMTIMAILVISHVALIFVPPIAEREVKLYLLTENYSCDEISEMNHNDMLISNYTNLTNYKANCQFLCKTKCFIPIADKSSQISSRANQSIENRFIKKFRVFNKETFLQDIENSVTNKDIHDTYRIDINSALNDYLLTFPGIQNWLINSTDVARNVDGIIFKQITEAKKDEHNKYITIDDKCEMPSNFSTYENGTVHGFKILTGTKNTLANETCEEKFVCVIKECHFYSHEEKQKQDGLLENELRSLQFWILFTLIILSGVTYNAVEFLIITISYEMLVNEKEKFGLQRLWETVGWGVGALGGGYINQIVCVTGIKHDYAPGFCLSAILLILCMLLTFYLELHDLPHSHNICKDIGKLLSKPDVIINIIIVYIIGAFSGLSWTYQFWFMEEIGSSQFLLGFTKAVECMAEVPCFLLSGWVIKRFGHTNCNNITFLCFGLHYLCYAYMRDPWMTIPVNFLTAPTFALFYTSMTMYGKKKAPPGTEATVQSLLCLSFDGIGIATGSILGGLGFDAVGSRATFLYTAIASFLMLSLNIFVQFSFLKQKHKN